MSLRPEERETVTVEIDRRELSYWDEVKGRWAALTGKVPVYIGSSAADFKLAGAITVK